MKRQIHTVDIVLIGAGPVGLVAAARFAGLGLRCAVIDRQPLSAIAHPQDDGREIALSHRSVRLLQEAGAWSHLDTAQMGRIRAAHVLDRASPHALSFVADGAGKKILATMVANHQIRHAAYQAAKKAHGIDWFCGQQIEKLETDAQGGTLVLRDGKIIHARLVIAADGRFSTWRTAQQIGAEKLDFKRTMIVVKASHALPHGDAAYECFQQGRTLAVLPLAGKTSSIVLTLSQAQADMCMALDAQDFAAMVTGWFGERFGPMQLAGERHAYPLVATYAEKFSAPSFALMGDAAVGMHPVTAHGFNFGLRGVEIMSSLVADALEAGHDFAGERILAAYDRRLRAATRPLYLATNVIATLYARTGPVSGILRRGLIVAGRNLPAARHLIERHLVSQAA